MHGSAIPVTTPTLVITVLGAGTVVGAGRLDVDDDVGEGAIELVHAASVSAKTTTARRRALTVSILLQSRSGVSSRIALDHLVLRIIAFGHARLIAHGPSQIADKTPLFAIRPPDNWDQMTEQEKLQWCEAVVSGTQVPPAES